MCSKCTLDARACLVNNQITHLGSLVSKFYKCSLCDYTGAINAHLLTNSHSKRQGAAGQVIVNKQLQEERGKIVRAQPDKIEPNVRSSS